MAVQAFRVQDSHLLVTSHSIPLNLYNTVFCPNVSVQAVPLIYLCIQYMMTRLSSCRIAPFEICGSKPTYGSPQTYRS